MRRSKSNLTHSDRVSEVISSPQPDICRKECGVGEEAVTRDRIRVKALVIGRAVLRTRESRCQLCTAVDRGNLRDYCVDVVGPSLDLPSLLENQLQWRILIEYEVGKMRVRIVFLTLRPSMLSADNLKADLPTIKCCYEHMCNNLDMSLLADRAQFMYRWGSSGQFWL